MKRRLSLGSLNLSHNHLLGRPTVTYLRDFLDETSEKCPPPIEMIDLSENLTSIRKAASVLEMRDNGRGTHVIYSKEQPNKKESFSSKRKKK
jgi:hypothetical protein